MPPVDGRLTPKHVEQRFSNCFQVGTTFISQNVLLTTLLLSRLKANLSFLKCSEHMLIPAYLYF
jgi:hypothetical protein